MPLLIELIGELGHVGGDLSLQRGGQHLTGAVADDLVQQRPTSTASAFVGLDGIVN